MDRPSQLFETSGGHKLVLRDYITGAEHREIRAIYLRALNKEGTQGKANQMEFDADNKAIKLVVVSLDDVADDIVERVLALPLPDFKEVVSQIEMRVEGKKKSETAS